MMKAAAGHVVRLERAGSGVLGGILGCLVWASACGGTGSHPSFAGPQGADDAAAGDAELDAGFTAWAPPDDAAFALADTGVSLGTGVCKDGTYTGPFSTDFYVAADAGSLGSFGLPTDASIVNLQGTLSLTLTQHQQGELSYTASGGFTATTSGLISATADISGTLNCSSGKFTGQVTNGKYSGLLILMGAFAGPMSADYDGNAFAFVNGQWDLAVQNGGLVQNGLLPGTWSAAFVGSDP